MLSHVLNSQAVCKTTFPALKGAYPPLSRSIFRSYHFSIKFYAFLVTSPDQLRQELCFFSHYAHFFVQMYRGVCVWA